MTELPDPVARVRATFDAVADDYDQSDVDFFGPIADGLVDALDPRPGDRVLDLGCGRGAVTLGLARRVQPGGTVTGLDVSAGMLGHARELLVRHGLAADLRVGDAGTPALPFAAYDVVASSLVLFFLPDPAATLARWVRLVAPDGRIGLATFGAQDEVWSSVEEVLKPWLPPTLRDPRTLDPDSPFRSDGGMEQLLTDAGAIDVRTVTYDLAVPFDDVEQWRAWSMGTGQRAMWDAVPEEHHREVLGQAKTALEEARSPDGQIVLTQGVRYTLGRA